MSFQIECPNCGIRPVWEFHFGGPVKERPSPAADRNAWTDYIYNKPNVCGVQTEWWVHRAACKAWFIVERDTKTNEVLVSKRHEELS